MKETSLINNATFQQKLLMFLKDLGFPLDYTQCEYIARNLIEVTYDRGTVKTVLTLTYKEKSDDE